MLNSRSTNRNIGFVGRLALCAAAAAVPQAHALPPVLTNSYGAVSTVLKSYEDCGTFRCDIAYSIRSQPVDRAVSVNWKDKNGATLVSGSNQSLGSIWNGVSGGDILSPFIDTIEWRKGVLLGQAAPVQATGTADFTGTQQGTRPCIAGFVCKDAEYYDWPPSIFSTTPGGGTAPSAPRFSTAEAPSAVPQPIGTIFGTLSNLGTDPANPDDIGGPRVPFIEFSSSVELDGAVYRYRYTATNFTDLSVPLDWAEAGLHGQISAFATVQRDFSSARAPGVFDSVPSWTFRTTLQFPVVASFANHLEVYAPVPEPRAWLQMAAGLVALVVAVRRLGSAHGTSSTDSSSPSV